MQTSDLGKKTKILVGEREEVGTLVECEANGEIMEVVISFKLFQ